MGNIRTTISGDAQSLLREQAKVAQGAAEVTNEYRELVREGDRLSRAGKRAWDSTRTPLEKYNQRISELNTLLSRGKIDADTHARAIERAREEMERAQESATGFGDVLKGFAASAGGILTASGAVAAFADEFERVHAIAERAADKLQESFATRGALAQVAVDQQDLSFLNRQADLFRTEGGASTQELANSITFALRSTGLLDDAGTYRALGRTGLVAAEDQASFINAIDSIRDALGAQEAGSSRELISKLLVASTATQKGAADIGRAVARAGASGRALGYSDEDVISAVSILTDPYGSADTAADRVKSLQEQIDKMGISATSLGGALDVIQGRVDAGQSIREVIGDRGEAIDAFRLLQSNRQQFQDLLKAVQEGNSGAALDAKLRLLGEDPTQAALSTARSAEGLSEVIDRDAGRVESLRRQLLETQDRFLQESGAGFLTRFLSNTEQGFSTYFGGLSQISNVALTGRLDEERARLTALGNEKALELLEKLVELNEQAQALRRDQAEEQQRERARQETPVVRVPQPGA